jgi:MraZ protein
MASFRGSFDYALDTKGRLNIPAPFRKALHPAAEETFVVTLAPDNCLRAYPLDEWQKFEDDLKSRPQTRATTMLKRAIYANTSESRLDGQNRITLKPKQLERSGITKEVTLIGQPGYIEIWDRSRCEAYLDEVNFDDVFYESVDSTINRSQ